MSIKTETKATPPERSPQVELRVSRFLSELLREAGSRGVSSVQTVLNPDGVLLLELFKPDNEKPTWTLTVPTDIASVLQGAITERSFFWPDAGDESFASNPGKIRRLLLAPEQGPRLMADLTSTRVAGTANPATTIHNFAAERVRPLIDQLALSDSDRTLLQGAVTAPTGIVLCNTAPRAHTIDGRAILLALRPDATYLPSCAAESSALAALKLAETSLVVVGVNGDDAAEMAFNFLGLFGTDQDSFEVASRRLVASFVYSRIRKVCSACARSTNIDPRTRERLPEVLRDRVKETYSFGRGCDHCGHSAYYGYIGLTSIVGFDDELRHRISKDTGIIELTQEAYTRGTRSLIEDGLLKISNGLASFEEVLSVASKCSPAFVKAITASKTRVTVPMATSPRKSIEALAAELKAGAIAATPPPAKRKLLLIEDDRDQRKVLEMILQSAGYELLTAGDGVEGFEVLSRETVDLIICDVMMPNMNGAQFIKNLRVDPKYAELPVLMLTAVSNAEAEYTLLSHGADDYCEKTVKRKVLLKRIERLLERKTNYVNPLQHMLAD